VRGWLIHCHKARDRHDVAARRCERMRYVVGVPAIGLPAVAGTTIFATIGGSAETAAAVVVGTISIGGAVLTALQTFLDYPGRAARHHEAGAKYKAHIRELEQLLAGPFDEAVVTEDRVTDIRARLDALEESSPVVGSSDWERVERSYVGAHFVGRAVELTRPQR
jgi:hypothetical protein